MTRRYLLLLAICMCRLPAAYGWGVWGHNHINKAAVLALPAEMGLFFYDHADFIVQESTVPDLRKYTLGDKAEGPRHYIDLEAYGYTPAALMPATLNDALARYGKDSLDKYGILPWYIALTMERLTAALRQKNTAEILLLAADLGHYVGDAHMPLHTTLNHNGQLTGQQGIHAFWESQLPELFGDTYDLYTGSAHYVADIGMATRAIIDSSYSLAAPLLAAERRAAAEAPAGEVWVKDEDGKIAKNKYGQPAHTAAYAARYHTLLAGMVQQQLRRAIQHTADLWYTAWINAGKPDLTLLDDAEASHANVPLHKAEVAAWQKTGHVTGCNKSNEFEQK